MNVCTVLCLPFSNAGRGYDAQVKRQRLLPWMSSGYSKKCCCLWRIGRFYPRTSSKLSILYRVSSPLPPFIRPIVLPFSLKHLTILIFPTISGAMQLHPKLYMNTEFTVNVCVLASEISFLFFFFHEISFETKRMKHTRRNNYLLCEDQAGAHV